MPRKKNKLLLSAFLLVYMPACFPENADREQPLHLESDQVLVDDARMISTFTGNVQLTQGTMLIRGDKIIVKQDKDGFKHGTMYGDPASFRQKIEGMDEYVEGKGERIEYDTRAEVIDFYEQAHVKRGLDVLRGEHITYNIKTEIFNASSGSTGSEDTPPKRVRAVLHPKQKNGSTTPPAPNALPINPRNTLSPAK